MPTSRNHPCPPLFAPLAALLVVTALVACDGSAIPTATPSPLLSGPSRSANSEGANNESDGGSGKLVIMTYNVYQGTELQNSVSSTTPFGFILGATQDVAMMRQTNFAERAQSLAAEIDAARPDLIGMQEVALWRTGPVTAAPDVTTHALTVDQDFLAILLDALRARGLRYELVSSVDNFDVQSPTFVRGGFMNVRLTDRDLIIARSGRQDEGEDAGAFTVSNPRSANFLTNLHLPTAVGTVTVTEGWASVDVATRAGSVRFVTTHLDAFAPPIRLAQAREILAGPANTTLPVVLAGDLHTTDATDTYAALRGAGFGDVWAQLRPSDSGFTCCQKLPEINNPVSILSERIDLMLLRGAVTGKTINRAGATESSLTPSGLWPSDHAGLVTELKVRRVH